MSYQNDVIVKDRVVKKEKNKIDLEKPPLYKVLIHNDDYTPFDFVISILKRFFNKSESAAGDIAINIHISGIGIAGIYPRDIAESKMYQANAEVAAEQHPLLITLEKE